MLFYSKDNGWEHQYDRNVKANHKNDKKQNFKNTH